MTGRPGKRARLREAGRLRAILEQLDTGTVKVSGAGHSLDRTRRRIEKRIAELEAAGS